MPLQKPLRKARGFDTWIAVGRTNLQVHRALNHLLGDLDLSLAQHDILVALHGSGALTQRQLSERLLMVKSNATSLLQKLEARGLIERRVDARDSRRKRVRLTAAGRRLVARSFERQNRVVEAMAATMTDAELAQVKDIMQRVGRALVAFGGTRS